MRWAELSQVFRANFRAYLGWLAANLGGLFIAYSAAATIWLLHRTYGTHLPTPQTVLISGTISLAVKGVSYLNFPRDPGTKLSPLLSTSWPFLVMAVYGVLMSMGVKTPVISQGEIWTIAGLIATACWGWASLLWAHEMGMKTAMEGAIPPSPVGPPAVLQQAAATLPKVGTPGEPEEGDAGAGN